MGKLTDAAFLVATLARRRLLTPALPHRVFRQLYTFHEWGYGLPGELRSAASRSPGRTALIDDDRAVTYGELVRRSEQQAAVLRTDLSPGDRVGLLARNHIGFVEAAVAIATVGADAVLMNTGLSGPQMATLAQKLGLRLLLHDAEFAGVVAAAGVPHLDLASFADLGQVPPARPAERVGRTIILTSGTTGVPRGVNRHVPDGMGPFASMISRIPLANGERMFIAAPLFHAWGYAALQLAFGLRGTAVLSRRFEPNAALDAIVANECTALVAVPVMLQRILDVPTRPTKLRIVAVSGSALPTGLPNAFMNQYGDVLYNLYGSTEVSWSSIATPKELRAFPGTAGRPPYGTVVAIVDADYEPVPAGGTGRIFVGNEMVSDGYTHGSLGETYRGLVNTGDLGHFDRNGLLYVDGRQDDMIISGGENVYPGPVERCIAALPAVRDVVVAGVKDVELGERLIAYIVCLPGETLDESLVRDHVRAALGRFAVPRSVIFLPDLPRSVTGKVLLRELPPPPDA